VICLPNAISCRIQKSQCKISLSFSRPLIIQKLWDGADYSPFVASAS
jgi:hypothetical protein